MTAGSVAQPRAGTFSALRSANFRLYFIGQLISISGTWMQTIAQGYLVFQLTKSEAWLGIVACAAGLPVVLLSPVSGAIVERIPRRPLILVTQAAQMVLAFILAALAFSGTITVGEIVALSFLLGVTNAIYEPARQIFIVEVVGPDELRSGITVHSIMNSGARVAGPALAGLALVQFGAAWCFMINAISFLAVIAMLWIMKVPHPISQIRSTNPLRQMKEGFDFARAHHQIAPLLLLALIGSIFVVPIAQLLPAFADVVLHSPDQGYAAMTAGTGIGSVVAGLGVAWLAHRLGFGRIIAGSVVGGALATALMAVQGLVFPAAFFAMFTGVFMTLLYVGINTDIQLSVPDAYRGRVMSIYTLTYLGIAPFGALALGFIANAIGTTTSLVLWGLAGGLLGGAVLLRWPHLLAKVVHKIT